MEIYRTSSTPIINVGSESLRRQPRQDAARTDTVATSKEVQTLSRHLPALRERLQPRAAVMEQFAGFADSPLDLSDRLMDRILEKI